MKTLYGKKPESMDELDWKELEVKTMAIIKLFLANDVMYHVMDDESSMAI